MFTVTGVLAFIVVFGAIVLVHEIGHFLVAKLVGVRPFEFGVGFGPALARKRWGETTYYLRALPLGGYVKLLGMDPYEEESSSAGKQQPPAEQGQPAASVSTAGAAAEDDTRSFAYKPLWARILTIAAGPLMNFVFAVVLFAVLFATVEVPLTIYSVGKGTPAERAGLKPGDEIVSIAGIPVREPREVNKVVEPRANQPLPVQIRRDGHELTLTVTPVRPEGADVARIGVQLGGQARVGGVRALWAGVRETYYSTVGLVASLGKMLVGRAPADISGPIGIFQLVGQTAQQGVPYLIFLAAILNINLGLLNLLPVPVLDGGWIAIFLVEAVRRRPLQPEHRGIAQMVGMALLLALMIFATYKDIWRLAGL
ncbi:MAG: site-2 protease family protein [Limnochordaceae bacterium]|nr:site-2 protease family protein [Limnochordaceae bacterium]